MAASALSPVSAAVFGVLSADATLMAATVGGWHDTAFQPNQTTFPAALFTAQERDVRGFGTGGLPEVTLRTHVFTKATDRVGMRTAQEINRQAIALLKDAALTIAGYAQAGLVFFDETVGPFTTDINGVLCFELVSNFRIYAEE